MNLQDFRTLIGASEDDAEYIPFAVMLRSGYACAGHYNEQLNEGMQDTIVVVNAQLIELKGATSKNRPSISDFSEFLEEFVLNVSEGDDNEHTLPTRDEFGKQIPLTAIPMDEIAAVYPVSRIGTLLKRAEKQRKVPAMFDLEKSEILSILKVKLW